MIVLTVKTLDSQNHTFTVDDDITVEQFKAKIADTVNIPAETQRIIYCGRVLQDDSKLNDYDVNGKVVHLVQRAPPSQNPPSSNNRSDSPHPTSSRRVRFNPLESNGNSMYLGSMAFQSNLLDSQNIMPPPPTHSLAGSRLSVARRMLRRAELVINALENPSAPPAEQNTEEAQEEEVTPIIEARVIVPSSMNDAIDEAAVLSAVQNSLFSATGAIPSEVTVENVSDNSTSNENSTATSSTSTTSEEAVQTENANGDAGRRPLSDASRTDEMAQLLAQLNRVQARFAPFLERYRQFMVDDPEVEDENLRPTQQILSRVSEVMHFLGHAYHSLSDIIIRVRTPPPRPLLCRPILIQHSAVVQAGIPIQVEAQFNLERSGDSNQNANNQQQQQQNSTNADNSATPNDSPSREQNGTQTRQMGNGHVIIPIIPPSANSTTPSATPTPPTTLPPQSTTTSSSSSSNSSSSASSGQGPDINLHLPGNSSFELFMEVTPEVQGNLANAPEFIQSLMQMAGRFIMNRADQPNQQQPQSNQTQSSQPQQQQQQPNQSQRREPVIIPNLTIIRSSASTQESNGTQSAVGTPGQNSQARGNTQTNPTTATYTRSTPRPHVQIAPPAAVQGLFDPFLMCNSHHVTMRRRHLVHRGTRAGQRQREQQQQSQQPQQQQESGAQQQQQQPQQQQQQQQQQGAQTLTFQHLGPMNAQNLLNTIFGGLRHVHQHHQQQQQQPQQQHQSQQQQQRPSVVSNGTQTASANETSQSAQSTQFGPTTIADILRELSDENTVRPGESILNDLIMLFSGLSLLEMMVITAGNLRPLERVRNDVQQFFLTRILDGTVTQQSMENGVNKILDEMRPFIEHFKQLPTRSNIDMALSIESVFRQRLPELINTAINLNSNNNMGDFVHQCVRLAKLICALSLFASFNGQTAVENTFEEMIRSYMRGTPVDMSNWTVMNSRVNLRNFITSIDIPENELAQYIVYKSENMSQENVENTVEPMECDETEQSATVVETNEASAPSLDDEPLPNVVIGSESWHAGVPEDWVPIITRDVQRQRRQSTQSPFSDAYLAGMPSKRRKIVNNSKPQGSLPQVITDSVRRAVTAAGLSNVTPLDVVAQAAGNSNEIQTAYRSLLRNTVQANLHNNEDFTPERFPNATAYFRNPQ